MKVQNARDPARVRVRASCLGGPSWLAGLSVLTLAAPAAAQENGTKPHAADLTIVVTAQYRPQDQVEVPLALTVFDGEFIERIGIDDFEELARFVPGLEVQNQSLNNPGFVMRGISSDSGVSFSEPRVSVFQDGVSISKVRGSSVELFDLERVEIVKGPQTTLYGRNALTGAVNVIQNKADPNGRSSSFRGETGNFNYVLSEAMVNLPLSERAAVRLSGRYRGRDGTVENLLGGRDFASVESGAARASLRLEPSDNVTIDLIGNYQHDEPTGTPFVSLTKRQTDPDTGALLSALDRYGGGALSASASVAGGRPFGLERDIVGVTGLAEYSVSDELTLSSVTGWRHFRALEIIDVDGISLPILSVADEGEGRQFSQDFRIRFDNGGPLSAFVGASYFSESGSQRSDLALDERSLLAQLAGSLNGRIAGRPESDPAPLAVLRNPALSAQLLQRLAAARELALPLSLANAIASNLKTEHRESQTNYARTRAWDLIADATLRPLDRLELTAGLRYSHERKRSGLASSVVNGRSVLSGFGAALVRPGVPRNAVLGALALPDAANIPGTATFPVFGALGHPTAGNGQRVDARLSDAGLTYRAAARFAPDAKTSIYLSYARGRRPKVLAVRTPGLPGGAPIFERLPTERLDSFELGAKAALAQPRLFASGSLFHYRYRNFQTTEQAGATFVVTNAGEARSTGFEGELRWHASDALELFGTYAYNHSRFRSGLRRGNRFRLSPDHSLAVGALGSVALGSGVITVTPSMTYQSKTFFSSDNDKPELQQPPNRLVADSIQDEFQQGFALFNARAGYRPANQRWRIEVFGENLFEKRFLRDAGNAGDSFGLPTVVRGTPRTFGVSFRFGFAD